MTKREQLYYLLESFNKGEYSIETLCDAYLDIYYPDIPTAELTDKEASAFEALGTLISRFSPYEEDIKKFPGVYLEEKDIINAIKSTIIELGIR